MIDMKQFPISNMEWILINGSIYREEPTKMFNALFPKTEHSPLSLVKNLI